MTICEELWGHTKEGAKGAKEGVHQVPGDSATELISQLLCSSLCPSGLGLWTSQAQFLQLQWGSWV